MFKHLIIFSFVALSFQIKAQQTFISTKQVFVTQNDFNSNETTVNIEFYKPNATVGDYGRLIIYNKSTTFYDLEIQYIGKKTLENEITTTYYIAANQPGNYLNFNVLKVTKFINGYKFGNKYNFIFSLEKYLKNSNTSVVSLSYLSNSASLPKEDKQQNIKNQTKHIFPGKIDIEEEVCPY